MRSATKLARARIAFAAACLVSSMGAIAQVTPHHARAELVPLGPSAQQVWMLNDSPVPSTEVLSALAGRASPAHLALLTDPQHLLYTGFFDFEEKGKLFCVAMAGLTSPPEAPDRMPRLPPHLSNSIYSLQQSGSSDRERLACARGALGFALDGWARWPISSVLDGFEATLPKGDPRGPIPAKDALHMMFRAPDLSQETRQKIMATVPQSFRQAFDYRTYAWTVVASWLDKGPFKCFAVVSLSALPPLDRMPRIAPLQVGTVISIEPPPQDRESASQMCMSFAARFGIAAFFDLSWDAQGMFKDFELTREDGVPLPQRRDSACAPADDC